MTWKISILNNSWLRLGFLAVLFFSSFGIAHTAKANDWTYVTGFEDYSTADVAGQDNWAINASDLTASVVETGSPYEGTKHVSLSGDTGGSDYIYRSLTPVSSGEVHFFLKGPASSSGYFLILLKGSGSVGPYFGLYHNTVAYGGSLDSLGSRDADAYVDVGLRFEATIGGFGGLSQYHASISMNGGAWQDFLFNNNIASVDRIDIQSYSPSGETWYVDNISIPTEGGGGGGSSTSTSISSPEILDALQVTALGAAMLVFLLFGYAGLKVSNA